MENNYIGYLGYTLPKIPKSINKMAADVLIRQLEKGKLPWQKPWTGHEIKELAVPLDSDVNCYRGINVLLLWSAAVNDSYTSNQWDTRKRWLQKEEKIRKGEQGTKIIQFHTNEEYFPDTEIYKVWVKFQTLYNRCQLESFRPTKVDPYFTTGVMAVKEFEIDNFLYEIPFGFTRSEQEHGYDYSKDSVCRPYKQHCQPQGKYSGLEVYWSTLFPALIKWAGHPERANRPTYVAQDMDGENLVAEIGAAFIAAEFRIAAKDKCFNKDRLAGYIKTIKDNTDNIVGLVNDASMACEYLFNLQPM